MALSLDGATGIVSANIQDATITGSDIANSTITNAKLANNAFSANSPGYLVLPNGIYIQWGSTGSIAGSGSSSVTFPIAFPTACLTVQVNLILTGAAGNNYATGGGTSLTTTGFTIYNGNTSVALTGTRWLAIGY